MHIAKAVVLSAFIVATLWFGVAVHDATSTIISRINYGSK